MNPIKSRIIPYLESLRFPILLLVTAVLFLVDLVVPEADGTYRLVGTFGDQITVTGKIKRMNLVDHRILFEE